MFDPFSDILGGNVAASSNRRRCRRRITRSSRCRSPPCKCSDVVLAPRMETNRAVTVWYDFQRCEETGRIDNFAKAAGLMKGEFRGIPFDDSDVYKVIEGAAYSLALAPDPKLDKYLDDLIAKIAAAQEPDGYLYTARGCSRREDAGHVRPGALVAAGRQPRALQRRPPVRSGRGAFPGHRQAHAAGRGHEERRLALQDLRPRPGQLKEPPGHEEIEIGLCKLYRATGQQRYLDLAKFYVELRGRADTHQLRGADQQDHKPIAEQDEAVGHAVRAGYFYSGVADVAALTGDEKLIAAIDRLWENVAAKKLYLTGGIGDAAWRRGLRRQLRTAQRQRLQRDLRRHRQRPLERADVPAPRRRQVSRRARAHDLQRLPFRRRAQRPRVLLPNPLASGARLQAQPVVRLRLLPGQHRALPARTGGLFLCHARAARRS